MRKGYFSNKKIVENSEIQICRLKYIQEKEAAELREKVEKANLVPPPIEKPNPLAENTDSKSRREQVKKVIIFAIVFFKRIIDYFYIVVEKVDQWESFTVTLFQIMNFSKHTKLRFIS